MACLRATIIILASALALSRCGLVDAEITRCEQIGSQGSAAMANINTLLGSLTTVTPGPGGYLVELPFLNGGSACYVGTVGADCLSCVQDAVDEIKSDCPAAYAATSEQENCKAYYYYHSM